MKLHDFIPGRAFRTLCLHGFAPQDSAQWEAAYRVLLRCHERLGTHPEWVVLDDVPGLSEETRSLRIFEEWLKEHPFPLPSMLSVGTSLIRGMTLPWKIDSRSYGSIVTGLGSPTYYDDGRPHSTDGGQFRFDCDAALYRSAYDVFNAMALDVWSSAGFEYGYACTSDDPTGFCMGGLRSKFPAPLNALRRQWSEFRIHTPAGRVYGEWMDKQQGWPVQDSIPGPSYSERLRDVFPLNYLVDTHLVSQVGNGSLGEWIRHDQARGTLRQLADGLWCWDVPEKNIPSVRGELERTRLLVAPGGR